MSHLADRLEPQIPALRRYAYALTRDPSAADDLVQDCLERAISRWYLQLPGTNLRAWLFTILHNLFISARRSERRRPIHVSLGEDHEASVGMPANQDSGLLGRDILNQLASLSEDHREILLLVAVEGMAYLEVARVLGLPLGTVMSRLSRAREHFRRQSESELPVLRRVR